MDDKIKFQEMLTDILEVARVQGNELEMGEIRSLFGDLKLSEEQYEHVFAYLAAGQIKIKGYTKTNSDYESDRKKEAFINEEVEKSLDESEDIKEQEADIKKEEDSAYLKMYLEDIHFIKEGTKEEEKELIKHILKGDLYAKNRLIESKLHYVIRVATEYKNQGITLEDLIQEGNMGLMCAVEALCTLREEEAENFIAESIRSSIVAAIREQKDSSDFEKRVMEKAKYIRDSANELLEDLGREANIHELAGYIKMTEEEITSILNMSADFVKLEKKHTHSS